MSLREQLDAILPTLLPTRENDAIKGKELIARVRAVLGDAYSDQSLRSQFSFMVLDPESCLARIPGGQGYYLRGSGEESSSLQQLFTGNGETDSDIHLAMALAVRLYDTAGMGVFVYPIEEEDSWGHPDIVAVQWPAGYYQEDGSYLMEEHDTDPTFRAVCIAFADSEESCRQAFFRTLACGQWAQEAELLLLGGDAAINEEELQEIAARYGVGVRCVNLTEESAISLPRAEDFFRMEAQQARELLTRLPRKTLSTPRHRQFSARRAASMPDITVVLQWAGNCMARGRVESYEQRVAVS